MQDRMSPLGVEITELLLSHHRKECRPGREAGPCLITYAELCERAGQRGLMRVLGKFLLETAQWCARNGFPLLNSLAISAETGMPGINYDAPPHCRLSAWPSDVRACIDFIGYPRHVTEVERRVVLRFESRDNGLLDSTMRRLIKSLVENGVTVSGAIPSPTRVESFKVISLSETYSISVLTHKRILTLINPNSAILQTAGVLEVPPGVEVKIKEIKRELVNDSL